MTGEVAGYVMEKLLNSGALDAFYTPIYMKKNRPAVKLSVLTKEKELESIKQILFQETTTIGFRVYKADRVCMERQFIQVDTQYGPIQVKQVIYGDIVKYYPEYEDCKKVAVEKNIPLPEVYSEIHQSITAYKK